MRWLVGLLIVLTGCASCPPCATQRRDAYALWTDPTGCKVLEYTDATGRVFRRTDTAEGERCSASCATNCSEAFVQQVGE